MERGREPVTTYSCGSTEDENLLGVKVQFKLQGLLHRLIRMSQDNSSDWITEATGLSFVTQGSEQRHRRNSL